jgi:hypothetical protein
VPIKGGARERCRPILGGTVHISVRLRLKRSVPLAIATCLVSAAAAQASCPTLPTSEPFAPFGDTSPYELAPGGSFEDGAAGWALDGADLMSGNESYFVGAPSDGGSLRLGAQAVALSPALCVDESRPTWRLFATKLTGAKGQLRVDMVFTDSSGRTKVAPAGKLSSGKGEYGDWQPTPVLKLGRGLPLSKSPGGTMSIRLRFTADRGGAWAVDDIYLDPYRS